MEARTSTWSDLDLGNKSLVLTQEALQLSPGLVESRIYHGIADLLYSLVLRNSEQSLVVLLNNVQSALELTELSPEVGILGEHRVELSSSGGPHIGLQTSELSSKLAVLTE